MMTEVSNDFDDGLQTLVSWLGPDLVLEQLEEDKKTAEKEVKRLDAAIAELKARSE